MISGKKSWKEPAITNHTCEAFSRLLFYDSILFQLRPWLLTVQLRQWEKVSPDVFDLFYLIELRNEQQRNIINRGIPSFSLL